ncbi:probable tRNA (guanine(26)-N(2))-dimethyltransferase isoform X2 [Folsomia candida]|uniref:tRNA (guanine(26)-N(2))-dimethyltransferase n=2 Tax=Folsomia candida TaxID=158441 RepID=A0A226E0W5_FOLCA|nr:probable tRNA (guanine(26)-N(2))-dimethyltransferase isoform X2 [Folsomia candida]XP_021957991.1 probable tRNA (guanine(26)-N(2))-dimethyltransferase isoform X2 [Folsomia candida]OXA50116.1 hypothetical protein Fcan01_14815 [Folsomia candida]
MADASMKDLTLKSSTSGDANEESFEGITEVREGKAIIRCDKKLNIFYNATQEVNRDISIVGVHAHILREKKDDVTLVEAMAASGIRSIRYALEVKGLKKVIANDFSTDCITSINKNSKLNGTEDIVQPSLNDANVIMRSQKGFIIDLDPYGSPAAFIDSAVHGLEDGGLFVVTATDMAGLAGGNAGEACFARYGAMPLKIKSCHEMALRILIHTVQSSANRYGRVAIPLLSLKIDFYVRLFFKIIKSPERAKESCINTSLVYYCTGCKAFNFQPLGVRKSQKIYTFARGPPVSDKCSNCGSIHHVGGPIWTGPMHDKDFVSVMEKTLEDNYSYLNTFPRIEGIINLVAEEVDVPLFYELSELCSVLKVGTIPLPKIRSAILNLGYQVSLSHIAPNTIKTTCPNSIIWDIMRKWKLQNPSPQPLKEGAGFNIMQKESETPNISFDLHPDANPASKENNLMRYQNNPTRNWGPGVRNAFKGQQKSEDKRIANQGKKRHQRKEPGTSNKSEPESSPSPESKCFKKDDSTISGEEGQEKL